ncbi:hypothetical protein BGZ99_008009 [Dissophora globulifera]|uniref:Uncharacterized protein n=1 Tax=Dissophora globulifera TaxID=979702 RepID=A0A9P6RX54_9FUNG|nr:hypothetical protein BGZ99_008009 [Dissophora globulifera]
MISSCDAIKNAAHSELQYYDIYLSSLHTEGIEGQSSSTGNGNSNNTGDSHSMSSKRRKGKKVQHTVRPKSRDLYADIVIAFKYKGHHQQDLSTSSVSSIPLSLSFGHFLSSSSTPSRAELEKQTMAAYEEVLRKLRDAGLLYETRPSGRETILIFVLCPWSVLKRQVVRNSVHDWLKGVKVADTVETEELLKPVKLRDQSLDDLTDSDRIRLIHDLITDDPNEGGAGIVPDPDSYVESVLPLHNWEFNKAWLKSWSTKWVLDQRDLFRIRDHFGEKVAYYFEFLEYYFLWLTIPTALGILFHFFGSPFSVLYSVSVLLWAIVFIESWKRRERELALWWGVMNVRKSEMRRHQFQGDSIVVDPVTDERVPFFSPWRRWARKIMGLPVILAGAIGLSVLVTIMFGVEVFLEVYYDGYMKEVLVYLPTILFSLAMPHVEDTCNGIAKRLTDFENHETNGSYDYHLVQKVFIFKILNSYLSVLLTAYVYIPFGPRMIATFQTYGLRFATVAIEPKMLQDRLQAFMISNQVISFFSETIYPWLSRRLMTGAVKIQKEVSEVLHHEERVSEEEYFNKQDPEDIKNFLKDVHNQVELPVYDVNEDYCEMTEQFGYITLFSVIWPLTGLCAFINNWIELRSDAAKICFHTRRPIPSRTDSIGPWMDSLEHLTWFSSLTNASILYLFGSTMVHQQKGEVDSSSSVSDISSRLSLSMLLFCLLASEHIYLGLRWIVKTALQGIPTNAELSARRKEYGVKRSWLSRLNDAVGNTYEAVVRGEDNGANHGEIRSSASMPKPNGTRVTKAAAAATMSSTRIDSMTPESVSRVVANGIDSLEGDLGAQAIRAMFKSS